MIMKGPIRLIAGVGGLAPLTLLDIWAPRHETMPVELTSGLPSCFGELSQ